MRFKKNYHIARRWTLEKVTKAIKNYPAQYATPKYLAFILKMIGAGWDVKVYEAGVSKYVFVVKSNQIFKIRFSNHKPLYGKEMSNDCDYYVGISHMQVSTTDQIISDLLRP